MASSTTAKSGIPSWVYNSSLLSRFPRPRDGCIAHLYGVCESHYEAVAHIRESTLPLMVGRAKSMCGFLVDSVLYKKVTSRVHAKITKSEANGIATLSIEDANAPNGTAVNFSRIRLSLLQDGDIIHFGGFGMGKTPLHRKVALPLKSDVAYILRYAGADPDSYLVLKTFESMLRERIEMSFEGRSAMVEVTASVLAQKAGDKGSSMKSAAVPSASPAPAAKIGLVSFAPVPPPVPPPAPATSKQEPPAYPLSPSATPSSVPTLSEAKAQLAAAIHAQLSLPPGQSIPEPPSGAFCTPSPALASATKPVPASTTAPASTTTGIALPAPLAPTTAPTVIDLTNSEPTQQPPPSPASAVTQASLAAQAAVLAEKVAPPPSSASAATPAATATLTSPSTVSASGLPRVFSSAPVPTPFFISNTNTNNANSNSNSNTNANKSTKTNTTTVRKTPPPLTPEEKRTMGSLERRTLDFLAAPENVSKTLAELCEFLWIPVVRGNRVLAKLFNLGLITKETAMRLASTQAPPPPTAALDDSSSSAASKKLAPKETTKNTSEEVLPVSPSLPPADSSRTADADATKDTTTPTAPPAAKRQARRRGEAEVVSSEVVGRSSHGRAVRVTRRASEAIPQNDDDDQEEDAENAEEDMEDEEDEEEEMEDEEDEEFAMKPKTSKKKKKRVVEDEDEENSIEVRIAIRPPPTRTNSKKKKSAADKVLHEKPVGAIPSSADNVAAMGSVENAKDAGGSSAEISLQNIYGMSSFVTRHAMPAVAPAAASFSFSPSTSTSVLPFLSSSAAAASTSTSALPSSAPTATLSIVTAEKSSANRILRSQDLPRFIFDMPCLVIGCLNRCDRYLSHLKPSVWIRSCPNHHGANRSVTSKPACSVCLGRNYSQASCAYEIAFPDETRFGFCSACSAIQKDVIKFFGGVVIGQSDLSRTAADVLSSSSSTRPFATTDSNSLSASLENINNTFTSSTYNGISNSSLSTNAKIEKVNSKRKRSTLLNTPMFSMSVLAAEKRNEKKSRVTSFTEWEDADTAVVCNPNDDQNTFVGIWNTPTKLAMGNSLSAREDMIAGYVSKMSEWVESGSFSAETAQWVAQLLQAK